MSQLPCHAGIGLKAQHYAELIEGTSKTSWLEIHPENYMGAGGPPHRYLSKLREDYPLSMHGVGMSLGSANGVDEAHLKRLKNLVDRYQPEHVSEHLSWSHWNSIFLNDLLPLPYTSQSLEVICSNIDRVQSYLGRAILIENPSTYINFAHSDYSEPDFFSELVKQCECNILLDINNIYVSGFNNGFDPQVYLNNFPLSSVKEIHLAGHTLKELSSGQKIRIDDHGSKVIPEVWELYEYFFSLHKKTVPTLIEWDTDIPELNMLIDQSNEANQRMNSVINNDMTPQKTIDIKNNSAPVS